MANREETPDFLEFAWIWNRFQGQPTPAPHRRIARWLQARQDAEDRRLLLMAFRGCGKSTLVGLFCAWRLLREPDTRILVLAADQALAVKMVAQVRRILERHPLCAGLRPNGAGRLGDGPLHRAAPCGAARPVHAGAGPRRQHHRRPRRPDHLRRRRDRQQLRHAGEAGGVAGAAGGMRVHPGARRHPAVRRHAAHGGDDLRAARTETAFLQGYRRLVLPLLDANGESAWPERFTPSGIEALRSRGRAARLRPADAAAAGRRRGAAARSRADRPLRRRSRSTARPAAGRSSRCWAAAAVGRRLLGPGLWPAGGRRCQRPGLRSMSMASRTATCIGWPT